MTAKQQNRKLGMEHLEKREVCAGNVNVFLDAGGVLNLVGDGNANRVYVEETSNYNQVFTIRGLDGTTINRQSEIRLWSQADSMNVNLGGGDDLLSIYKSSFRKLDVNTGSGRDEVWMTQSFVSGLGNSVNFNLGAATENERDTLTLTDAYFGGNLNVELGGGDDTATFYNMKTQSYLNVSAGGGYDTYRWTNSTYGLFWLWSGFEKGSS